MFEEFHYLSITQSPYQNPYARRWECTFRNQDGKTLKGGNWEFLTFWEPLILCNKTRLSGWKFKHLFFGGRLIRLKSVMSSIAWFTHVRVCMCVCGSDDHKNITWIDWNSVCLWKKVVGLGVNIIKEFNSVLLEKWC